MFSIRKSTPAVQFFRTLISSNKFVQVLREGGQGQVLKHSIYE